MFSKELQELDRNTVQYMIEEQQKELEKKENIRTNLSALRAQIKDGEKKQKLLRNALLLPGLPALL